jgi:hypothetical protein
VATTQPPSTRMTSVLPDSGREARSRLASDILLPLRPLDDAHDALRDGSGPAPPE